LTSNVSEFAAGSSATITATTDADVAPTASIITVTDETTSTTVATCTSGTTCQASVSFYSGGAHTYIATVNSLSSNEVTVARQAWAVALTSTETTFAAGDAVTLTATANQSVSATGSYYWLGIYDVTTNSLVNVCLSGTVCTANLGSPFDHGAPHTYAAAVSAYGGSYSYSIISDVQAVSNNVVLTRAAWTVTLASNTTDFAVGESVTLTATVNQNLTTAGGYFGVAIFDQTTDELLTWCHSGITCALTSSSLFYTGGPHTYVAEVAQWGSGYTLETVTPEATSNEVTIARAAWAITLSGDATSFSAGQSVAFSTVSNQSVGGSNYGTFIFDATTGSLLYSCHSGTACNFSTADLFWSGGPHSYVAVVSDWSHSGGTLSTASDVQATSNTVTLSRTAWTISLSTDSSSFPTGQFPSVTATTNQVAAASTAGYQIFIYDETDGTIVANCWHTATYCTTPVGFFTGGPHTYRALVAAWHSGDVFGEATDIQAQSNDVAIARLGWSVSLTASQYEPGWNASVSKVTLSATANQSTGSTNGSYLILIYDYSIGAMVHACSGSTCYYEDYVPNSDPPHVFVAYIASYSYWTGEISDVQAVSNGASPSGPIPAAETAGGSNASVKDCTCSHGDPINTSTGEFFLPSSDLGIAGVGPSVAVSRTYSSSIAAQDGPFGYGWSSNFQAKIVTLAAGDTADPLPRWVQVVQENGAVVPFSEGPDHTYFAPPQILATLTYDPITTVWTFTRQLKQVMTFDSAGRLATVGDLHGNSVTVGRNSSGDVTSVAGSGGRSIALSWSGGHVTLATDSAGRSVAYDYNSAGNLSSATAVDGSETTYGYNSAHFMTTVTKPGGGVTTNTYDSSHRVSAQEDPLGGTTTFSYSGSVTTTTAPDAAVTVETYADGQMVSQTRGAGTSAEATELYTYDTANNVASVTDPLGKVTSYTYDARGNKLTETDPLNRTTSWTYDDLGDVLSVVDPLSRHSIATYNSVGGVLTLTSPTARVQSWTYNADGTTATWVDGLGKTSHYAYDSAGNQTSSTDPDGRVQSISYNAAGIVTATTDAAGKITTITSDAAARVLTVTDPNGNITTYEYDADGNIISVEDPAGNTTTSVYDDADQLLSTTNANGKTTHYEYSDGGYVTSVTDPNSHATSYEYNALGQVTSVTDANNHTTHLGYDGAGRKVSVTLPSGAQSSREYDDAGQVTATVDGEDETTQYAYDADGELVSLTDPLNRVTSRSYTGDGQIGTITYPDSSTNVYTYDAVGQTTDFENADGKHTTYVYDDAGLLTSKTEPGSLTTAYSYTAAGQPHVVTRPDATTYTNTYDDGGRLTGVHFSATASTDISYAYNNLDLRTEMVDSTGTSTYSYDNVGQLTSQTNGAGATIGYNYDDAGRLHSLTYPGSRTVTYSYDAGDQMTSLTDWSSNETDFDWTVDGQLASQTDPNGVEQTRSYDAAGHTTEIETATSSSTLASFDYDYDAAGQLTSDSSTDPISSTPLTHDYGYDAVQQLTTVDDGTTSSAYSATSAGLLTATKSGSTLAYNSAEQLTSLTQSVGLATSYSYDANGSRVGSTVAADGSTPAATTGYSYDPSGSLVSVSVPATSSASAFSVDYTTDGDGLRQSRTVGSSTKSFVWSTVGGLPLLLDDGSHSYIYGPSSAPVAQVTDSTGTVRYLHSDLLGSTRLITSSTGAVVGTTRYDEYGNRTAHGGTVDSAIGYTGNLTDADSGLVYLRARDYDPATAQFLSVDPAVDSTRQPYAYVANNPLQFTDPTGLDFWSDLAGNAAAFGAGVLDGVTFGASSAILGAVVPGYNCFVSQHQGFFDAGSITGTIASSIAVTLFTAGAGAGLAVAGIAGRLAIKEAATAAIATARRLVTAGAEKLLARGAERSGARAAETATASARAAGRTGEELAGIVKNTEHIPSASGGAAYRIPDELTSSVLGEVKNVSRLSYTNQLRDFAAYANANELQFNLYVRGGTQLSGPLQRAVDSGVISLIRNLL
jgi:RHS repeat-associated protein